MSLIVSGVVAAVGLGISAYGASKQAGLASDAEGIANAQFGDQQWYNDQLKQLITNPNSFTSSPIFQNALNVGEQGVARNMTAQGFGGSGNEAAALETYGQSGALSGLFQQEQILGSLTGLNANPATAINAASNANATGMSILSGGLNAASFAGLLATGQLGGVPGAGGGANGLLTTDTLNSQFQQQAASSGYVLPDN